MLVKNCKPGLILLGLFFFLSFESEAQNANEKAELLDLKLQLIESKLQLLESKLSYLETKPRELISEIEAMQQNLKTDYVDPELIRYKVFQLDSLNRALRKAENSKSFYPVKQKTPSWRNTDSLILKPVNAVISLYPVELGKGTLMMSYEQVLGKKLGLDASASVTYADENGLSKMYLSNQSLEYYNDMLSSTIPYYGKNFTGFGFQVQLKNYLLSRVYANKHAPLGLYAAPHFMYKKITITGESNYYDYNSEITIIEKVTRELDVYAYGAVLGWKFSLLKVLSIDTYVGGIIRLSKYHNSDGFTKHKDINNVDYSGVMPTFGISIGILK